MKMTNAKLPNWLLLLITYLFFAIFRFLMATVVHLYPTIAIDELLYFHLGRSIANGGGLLFMGQPADYTSILYPLVLSPIYALFPKGANYFQLMQLWNSLLMNLSIFPIYALAKAITEEHKKAYIISVFSLLLPDMILSSFLLSEAILYPIFFSVMYFAWQYKQEHKLHQILLVGLLGGLLYCTKPGQIIPAVVVFLLAIVNSIKERSFKQIAKTMSGILATIAVIALSYLLIYKGFNHPANSLGLYEAQLGVSKQVRWDYFLKGLIVTPYHFVLCSGICLFVAVFKFREYSQEKKEFFFAVILSVIITIIGTAWTINLREVANYAIHTRYIAMYIPLVIIFAFMPQKQVHTRIERGFVNDVKQNISLWLLISFCVFCSVLFGCGEGVVKAHIFSLGMALFYGLSDAAAFGISCVIALAIICLGYCLPKIQNKKIEKLCVGITAFLIVTTNIGAYSACNDCERSVVENYHQIESIVGAESYLGIFSSDNRIPFAYADVNNPDNTQFIPVAYMNDAMKDTLGIYKPFVPPAQRGNISQNETPDTDLLLMDQNTLKWLKLSETCTILTPNNSMLQAIRIPLDEPWIKYGMYGLEDGKVKAGAFCEIAVYDKALCETALTVEIDMELTTESKFAVYYGAETLFEFTLPAGRDTYTINVPVATDALRLSPIDSDMHIYGYTLVANANQ